MSKELANGIYKQLVLGAEMLELTREIPIGLGSNLVQ